MTASHSSAPEPGDQRWTYVLDTSVLLSDPWAMSRFAEHAVVLPLVVINELEGKRHHPELGWFAREALRLLDDLRKRHDADIRATNEQPTAISGPKWIVDPLIIAGQRVGRLGIEPRTRGLKVRCSAS